MPLTVDSIQIFAGQRYSFILNTNQPINNYWIRAPAQYWQPRIRRRSQLCDPPVLGRPHCGPYNYVNNFQPLGRNQSAPLVNAAAPGVPTPGAADVNLNLAINFDFASLKFTVNGATFQPPTLPVLLQIMSGASTATDLLPAGSVYTLPPNKVIEISMPGGSIGSPVSAIYYHA